MIKAGSGPGKPPGSQKARFRPSGLAPALFHFILPEGGPGPLKRELATRARTPRYSGLESPLLPELSLSSLPRFRRFRDSVTFCTCPGARIVNFRHFLTLSAVSPQNISALLPLCTGTQSRAAQEYSSLYREQDSVFPEESRVAGSWRKRDSWLSKGGVERKVSESAESDVILARAREEQEERNRARMSEGDKRRF